MKPTQKQCEILDKMIRNHKDRVLTSYMDGDTLIVETEYKKYFIKGQKGMKNIAMWILMVLVALWIVSLPAICKAGYDLDLAGISTNLTYIDKSGPRPWTNGEKTVLWWSILATITDMFTTCKMLNNPDNYEMNPWLGRHPSDGNVVAVLSISHIVCVAISHWTPEITLPIIGKVNMRYSLLGSKAALNTYFTFNNAHLDW